MIPRTLTTAKKSNLLALRHGAQSPAVVEANLPAAVADVQAALSESLTYLQPPDGLLVEQLARLVVRIRLVDGCFDRLGGSLIDSQGRPPS